MRYMAIALSLAGLAQLAFSQDADTRTSNDPRQAVITAAKESAVQKLLDEIEPALILPNLSVGDLLSQTGGAGSLRDELESIDPVGGPRWLDERTCQVRLEISGTEVVVDLANIAARHPELTPIAANDLPNVADRLSARYFAAIGTSSTADEAPPPPPDNPWDAVPPDVRQRAIHAAEIDAAGKILSSIGDVELAPGYPLGGAFAHSEIRQSLTDWIVSRPIMAIDYGVGEQQQLEVKVTLAANPPDLFQTIRATLMARTDVPHPANESGWYEVRRQIIKKMANSTGEASPPSLSEPGLLPLPAPPPDWTTHLLDVTGIGGPSPSPLRAARSAEMAALKEVRHHVMELQIYPKLTIGRAAAVDPNLARAVDRAITRYSRLYQSDYMSDGRVSVQISLNLHFIWIAIEDRR